ncbi:MAG: hypothetical protein KAI73_06320 [Rhodospirillaceae bacterium]|nr:hypothetical protein [Rhodospirillaceae bacterium]
MAVQRPSGSFNLPLTAFDDLRVAELSPIFQVSFEFTVTNTEIGTIETTNSGTVAQAEAMCVVSTGTTTGSAAEWETVNNSKYRPGLGGVARFTALFTEGVEGTEQSVGLEDADGAAETHLNGYAVGYNGAVFSLFRWQNDALFTVAQQDWDDPMDGTGASGMTLDPTKINVYFVQFQYLGGGPIKLWIGGDESGKMILAHTVLYTNKNIVPSVFNPNFHLMIHAVNGVTTSDMIVKSSSMAYFVEGQTAFTELQQPQFSSGEISKAGVTTEVAIFTIRNKTTYASKVNFIELILENIGGSIEASSANNLGRLRLVKDATIGGTPNFVDINTTDSIVDIDVAGTTVTDGKELLSVSLAGKNDRVSEGNLIPYKILLHPGDTITLAGFSENSAIIKGSLLWKELF